MSIPADIAAWIERHGPCLEGAARLTEHESMAAAWEASSHGAYLTWILKREGKLSDAAREVARQHMPEVRKAQDAAPSVVGRLQDHNAAYAKVLADFAVALKNVVGNPFVR